MANTLFATEQYEDRSVTGGKIALTTILNENISATADIARTKILNTAVTEGDGGTVTGTINIGGGTFILPQGTTLPTVGLVEGQIFWKTDTNQLFVFDGTIFQDAGGAHAFGGAEHIADTLVNVNSKISDATLDDSSAARPPLVHASSHSNAGSDEITVENLGTVSTDVSRALRPNGSGGLVFTDVDHNDLTGVTADQHHAQDHASRHSNAGPDEITAENLGTASTDTSNVLKPNGAGGLTMADLNHNDLAGIGANDHHNQSHVLATNTALGSDHTITGAASGQVLRASSATAANFQALGHGDLAGVGADDHHNQSHVLATTAGLGPDHTTSGLTIGQVLRASGATSAAFAQLQHSDLGGVGANDHHNEDHASRHSNSGADEVTVENLGTASTNTTFALKPDGAGGVIFSAVTKSDVGLGNVENLKVSLAETVDPTSTDDVNAGYSVGSRWINISTDKEFVNVDNTAAAAIWKETTPGGIAAHASTHSNSGIDEITAENLGTVSTDVSNVLKPDGAGGLTMADLSHGELTGIGANDHHPQTHVLATTAGLGPDHTTSGLTIGQVLRASGATTAAFAQLQHSDLGGLGVNDHHNQSHVLATNTALGPDHTITGATAGQVLRASSATAANFQQLVHGDLGGVGANDHHNQSHVLATTAGLGPDHTTSGLTVGQVLRASGATAAAFAQLSHSDLGGVGIDDHHARDHAATHSKSGADEISVEALGTAETDTSLSLKPDGSGGLVFAAGDGTVNTVTTTDATVTTIATIAIPDNTVVLIKVDITGRRTNGVDRAGYIREVVIFREAAGPATLEGSVNTPLSRETVGGYNATISVSGNNALVTVRGAGGHTMNWKSKHVTQEIA